MSDDILDLDAIRPERKPKKVRVRGKMYTARNPSMGSLVEAIEASQNAEEKPAEAVAAIRLFMVEIFGEEAEQELIYTLDQTDYAALLELLVQAYADEGKVPGPSRASRRAGVRSKPTSKGSTASISAKRASAQNGSVSLGSPV